MFFVFKNWRKFLKFFNWIWLINSDKFIFWIILGGFSFFFIVSIKIEKVVDIDFYNGFIYYVLIGRLGY